MRGCIEQMYKNGKGVVKATTPGLTFPEGLQTPPPRDLLRSGC